MQWKFYASGQRRRGCALYDGHAFGDRRARFRSDLIRARQQTCPARMASAADGENSYSHVGDLEGFLASGNVTVTTTGSGVQANDITSVLRFGGQVPGTLSLEANRSIAINAAASITGLSRIDSRHGKHGALSFGRGNATVGEPLQPAHDQRDAYTLAGDIRALQAT